MSSVTTISIEEFEATFKPEANHLVESDKASFCGWMYETYGVEDEYIRKVLNETPARIWTSEEEDGGFVVFRNHYSEDAIGYIVTEVSVRSGQEFVVRDEAHDELVRQAKE